MPSIEEIKARLQGLNQKTKKSTGVARPKDEHDYRLVRDPNVGPDDDPFQTRFFHENLNGMEKYLCPLQNFGEDCEVCEDAKLLQAWKSPDGVDKPVADRQKDFEIFRKIQAKARVFVPRLERGKEAEGLKWWDMTSAVSLKVIELCASPQRLEAVKSKNALDILFGETLGYDVHVSVAPPGKKGNTTNFHQTIPSMPNILPSKLAASKKEIDELKKTLQPLDEALASSKVTSAQMSVIWKKFIGSGGQPVEGASAADAPASEKYAGNHSEDASKPGGQTIDQAFDKMLAKK